MFSNIVEHLMQNVDPHSAIDHLIREHCPPQTVETLKRGEILYHAGDTPRGLYIVDEGLLGLFFISENGKESFLRIFSPGSLMGHRAIHADEPYHATSIALSACRVSRMDTSEYLQICYKEKQVLESVLKKLSTDLREAELRLAGLGEKAANQRICESLVFLKLKYPDQKWTRKEIAEYSGSTFETVTRVMSRLEELSLIKKDGRNFDLNDAPQLIEASKTLKL
jgi:CRP-like cAMP-binding protein